MSRNPTMEDYEDDDFEELDDVLDEFAGDVLSKPPGALVDPSISANTGNKPTTNSINTGFTDNNSAGATATTTEGAAGGEEISEEELQKFNELMDIMKENPKALEQLEALLQQMAIDDPDNNGSASTNGANGSAGAGHTPEEFQNVINSTINRLKESDKSINESMDSGDSSDILAELMKQATGADGEGGFDMAKVLVEMLEQLCSKEILYEPMKELNDKYPEWWVKNEAGLNAEDKERYGLQKRLVSEIVTKFEAKDYNDSSKTHREYISTRLEEMQSSGAPPQELMGDSGPIPGFTDGSAGAGLPGGLPELPANLEENCAQT